MTDRIFDAALALGGSAPENETALRVLCGMAEQELRPRLRRGVTAEALGDCFVQAAAMLALAFYTRLRDVDDRASFRAGNVSVTRRGAGAVGSSADALRRQAETLLAFWLEDSGFSFRGVRG